MANPVETSSFNAWHEMTRRWLVKLQHWAASPAMTSHNCDKTKPPTVAAQSQAGLFGLDLRATLPKRSRMERCSSHAGHSAIMLGSKRVMRMCGWAVGHSLHRGTCTSLRTQRNIPSLSEAQPRGGVDQRESTHSANILEARRTKQAGQPFGAVCAVAGTVLSTRVSTPPNPRGDPSLYGSEVKALPPGGRTGQGP